MKKVILIFLLLPFLSCSEKKKESNPNDAKIEAKDTETKEVQSTELSGVYEYVYEHNTDDFKENHYIEFIDGEVVYYGTSDDFDDAREGYEPGFFKAKVNNFKKEDVNVSFTLIVSDSIFFKNAITPLSESDTNEIWGNSLTSTSRKYAGSIKEDTIVIITEDFDPRVFVKIKSKSK